MILFDNLINCLSFSLWTSTYISFLLSFRETLIHKTVPKKNQQWPWNQRCVCFYHADRCLLVFISFIRINDLIMFTISSETISKIDNPSSDLKVIFAGILLLSLLYTADWSKYQTDLFYQKNIHKLITY